MSNKLVIEGTYEQKRESLEDLLFEVTTALLTLVDADTIEMEGKDPYFTLKITTLTLEQQAEIEADEQANRTLN